MRKLEGYDYAVTRNGDIFSLKSMRFLKSSVCKRGYHRVHILKNGIDKTMLVHRIVATAWIPNPENKPTVNHIDGNKSNNCVSNLEWATYSENNIHALEMGLKTDTGRVLNEDQARFLFQLIMDGHRKSDVCRILGINDGQYRWYVYSDTYKSVRNEYDLENRPRKSSTISDEKVVEICKLLEARETPKNISKRLNISSKKIYNIKRRQTFRNISQSFSF